ncbi:hypothetical protein GYMLUDRAFT_55485 [Collybiopsis luxurians FD-317 M1]|nr:hypothetical protein GYMLUDRAFT_55485 [Collybiopsis luxurians FD-317 M1]
MELCPEWDWWKAEKDQPEKDQPSLQEQSSKLANDTKSQQGKGGKKGGQKKVESKKKVDIQAGRGQPNTLHSVPLKMAWLNNQRIKHEDCQTKHKMVSLKTLLSLHKPLTPPPPSKKKTQVMHLFIEKFGHNLALLDDPDPGIDYTLYNVEDFPEDQRKEEQK